MIIRLRHIVSGIPGVNGLSGSTGAPGHDGRDGIRGEQGSPGKTGPQGPTGAKGMKGERCITGPVGPKGDRRERGDSGIQAGPHNKCSHLNWKECTFTRVDGKERSISKLSVILQLCDRIKTNKLLNYKGQTTPN